MNRIMTCYMAEPNTVRRNRAGGRWATVVA
jgi:hypothetical protein